MDSLNWNQLVSERNDWVAHNFPDHTGNDPALSSVFGVIEELGELVHHHLKEDQQIRGNADFHQKEAKDAIGDITVYLLGVMHHYKVRPGFTRTLVLGNQTVHQRLLKAAAWVGRLADNQSVWKSKRQAQAAVDGIVCFLTLYCESREWDYGRIVQDTWDHVKMRDWIKYPDTGLPPDEELRGVRGEIR